VCNHSRCLTTAQYAILASYFCYKGTSVARWLRCCTTNPKVAGSIPDGVIGIFHLHSFRSHCGPGVDSTSNRNENQEYFLGVKSGRCVRLTTLPPSWATVTESGNLNFLEPSGHLGPVTGLTFFSVIMLMRFNVISNCRL